MVPKYPRFLCINEKFQGVPICPILTKSMICKEKQSKSIGTAAKSESRYIFRIRKSCKNPLLVRNPNNLLALTDPRAYTAPHPLVRDSVTWYCWQVLLKEKKQTLNWFNCTISEKCTNILEADLPTIEPQRWPQILYLLLPFQWQLRLDGISATLDVSRHYRPPLVRLTWRTGGEHRPRNYSFPLLVVPKRQLRMEWGHPYSCWHLL